MTSKKTDTNTGPIRPFWFGVLVFSGAVVGTFSFFVLGLLVSEGPLQDAFISAHGVLFGGERIPLAPSDREALLRMIESGQVLPAQDFISDLSSFYEAVIQILVTVLSVLGILAYMYIRSVSTERAEQAAESKAERVVEQYLASHAFWDLAKRHAEESVSDAKEGLLLYQQDLQDLWGEFVESTRSEFDGRLMAIEKRLATFDTEEAEGEALQLQNQPAAGNDVNINDEEN